MKRWRDEELYRLALDYAIEERVSFLDALGCRQANPEVWDRNKALVDSWRELMRRHYGVKDSVTLLAEEEARIPRISIFELSKPDKR